MKENTDFRIFYDIIGEIGRGDFFMVYKAVHKKSREERAIKLIDINKIKDNYKIEKFCEPTQEDMK